MLYLKHITLLSILSLAIFACQDPSASEAGSADPNTDVADPAHNSMNSLDWSGSYSGVEPSANGAELRRSITLNSDGSYVKTTQAENTGKSDIATQQKGKFTWEADGSRIVLHSEDGNDPKYLVGENQLFLLDAKGERIKSDDRDKYVLRKDAGMGGMPLIDTYWKLVELSGQAIAEIEGRLPAHIVISNEEKRAAGNSGCNSFFSSYELDQQAGKISFQQAGSTMMACIDMRTEEEFLKNLVLVDEYSIDGRTLTFGKAGEGMLMRFEAVDL